MILELCKGVHCVDLDESFQTHIFLPNLASVPPRTSPVTFAVRRSTPVPRRAPLCLRYHAILRRGKRYAPATTYAAAPVATSVTAPATTSPPLLGGQSKTHAKFAKIAKIRNFLKFLANFWRARSRLYRSRFLQVNM